MNLSDISIRNPVFAWMLMVALLLFGGICFMRMGISQFPDVDFPVANVRVTLEGAAPEVMEKDVIEPLESSIVTVQGIRSISSSVRNGAGNISVEFDLDKDIDTAIQEIQTQIARAQRLLPPEIDPPVVYKSNPEDRPIMWIGVSSETLSRRELMVLVKDRIRDQFTTINGVSELMLAGYIDPAVRVDLSLKKLNHYQLTVDDILSTIQREHIELPAGRVTKDDREAAIRVKGEAQTIDEFANIQIKRRGGAPNYALVRLNDVAQVYEGLSDVRMKSRVNGVSAIGLAVRKQRGSNAVAVSEKVREKLELVNQQLPSGTSMRVVFDSTQFIKESVNELIFTLILSAILTALVSWLFLGSFSSTINVILAIPTSVVGSFIVLYALGFTLNSLTLLALSLAIGIVVDDAIIVLENIVRHRELGKPKKEAALFGAREITLAVMATTAAVIAIFLPVAYMEGIIGKFFFQFAVTMSVAVALSCVEALTLAPMRCSQFLQLGARQTKVGRGMDYLMHHLTDGYARSLGFVLQHRWKTLTIATVFFVSSLLIFRLLDKEFAPSQDESRLFVSVKTQEGTSLDLIDRKMKEIEEYLKSQPDIDRYLASIGGGMGANQVNSGSFFITLKDPKHRQYDPELKRKPSQNDLADKYRKHFKTIAGAKIFIQGSSSNIIGGHRGSQVEFTIRGPSWDELLRLSDLVVQEMETSGMFTDVRTDDVKGIPEISVVPDRKKANLLGVDVNEISKLIEVLFGGKTAGFFTQAGQRSDIRVQLAESDRSERDNILEARVRNNRGELIRLRELVVVKDELAPQTIAREDRVRAIGISANPAAKVSQAKALTKAEEIGKRVLPKNYYLVMSGTSEVFRESFQSLVFVLILGFIVAYMVLASQFNSFVDPITILMALPFSVSGAMLALYVTGQSINIYSLIGLILLMGIAKKNSILLVEFSNQLHRQGLALCDAVKQACPIRFRPILMTSISTIVAAIPPALSLGPGAESRIPMATVVIGGIMVSTVFTLYVVPCFYLLVAKLRLTDATEYTGNEMVMSGAAESVGHRKLEIEQTTVRSSSRSASLNAPRFD